MNLKTASLQTSCFRISPIWPETSQSHLFFYSARTIGHLFVKIISWQNNLKILVKRRMRLQDPLSVNTADASDICLSSFIIVSLLHETLVAKIWNWNSKWTSSVRRYCYVHLRILLLEPLASFLSSLCVGYPVLLMNLHPVRPLSTPAMTWLLAYEKPTNHNIGIFFASHQVIQNSCFYSSFASPCSGNTMLLLYLGEL